MAIKTIKGFCQWYNRQPHCLPYNESYLKVVRPEIYGRIDIHAGYTGTVVFSTVESSPDTGIYERVFAARNTKRFGFQMQEILVVSEKFGVLYKNCVYILYGMSSGLHVYGWNGKSDFNCYYTTQPYMKKFEPSDIEESRCYRMNAFEPCDVINLDPSLKYFAYKSNFDLSVIGYIRLYRKFPIAEMCAKLNLWRFCTEKALKTITDNKPLRTWIFKNANQLSKERFAFQTAYNAFKHNPAGNPADYAKYVADRTKYGKQLQSIDQNIRAQIIKLVSPAKIISYLMVNKIDSESYSDYLKAALWLKLDISDTKVLFPKKFKKMHDDYTSQYQEFKFSDLNKKMKQTSDAFRYLEYQSDAYSVLLAESKSDLINEGEKLHHCVGRMDYDRKQANGESIICFIRKNKRINKPFVTVEVVLDKLRVKQCYGYGDSIVEEVKPFVKKWMAHCRACRNRRDKKAA